jgi:NAD(P)-dependent dehydrogenase (short-subunit alcohol dehydrogenase family)
MGQAISRAFAQNGADVCLISRKLTDVEALAEEVEKWGVRAFAIQGDVSDSKQAGAATQQAIEKLGGVDILVCAAGFPFDPGLWNKSLHELADDDFAKVFNSDVMGSFRAAKEVIPEMTQRKSGVIILFSSTPAISGYNKGSPYTVAKSAVRGLAKEIAYEYGPFNIRAYAIAPGNIKTDATFNNLSKEEQNLLASESPMKRWGDPFEVARVCVVLGSDNMSFVTGQTIVVDGGTVML